MTQIGKPTEDPFVVIEPKSIPVPEPITEPARQPDPVPDAPPVPDPVRTED